MVFNSITFLIFLALLLPAYWWSKGPLRHLILFTGGLIFYGFWRIDFLAVLLFSITFDYTSARIIDSARTPRLRWTFLVLSVSINLLLLMFFKYTYFFLDNINAGREILGYDSLSLPLQIILPLGISFYTFHSLSYVVDVYRRVMPAEKNFVLFIDYVLFFPQLVAGPILRAKEVIPQFKAIPPLTIEDVNYGIKRILEGLFLKVVLADNISLLVDPGYQYGVQYITAWDVWTLTLLFGLQIYFDFAGYSSIAIGIARLLGIRFPENFNFPYIASSPKDFWKRWHISLSSWIRDYLYLPLLGRHFQTESRGGLASSTEGKLSPKAVGALVATWLIMGFWHGANWTFMFWGLWHAALVIGHRLTTIFVPSRFQSRVLGWAITIPLIMLGWVPFRSSGLAETFSRLGKVISPWQYLTHPTLSLSWHVAAILLFTATLLWGWGHTHAKRVIAQTLALKAVIDIGYWTVIISLIFVYFRPITQFIYFQF